MFVRLLFFIQKQKQHISLVVFVILSLTLILNSNSDQLDHYRLLTSNFNAFLKSPSYFLKSLKVIDRENQILKEELTILKLQLESMYLDKAENSNLREMLDFKRDTQLDLVPAKVINEGLAASLLSLTIDVGSNYNIQKNSPVLTPFGIIGKIVSVGKTNSVVQLISDPNFRVGVRFLPSGVVGILRWHHNNYCEVREVGINANINVGDRVISSGLSDIFPPELPVGKVIYVKNDKNSFQKTISVEINNKVSTIMNVFVIVKSQPE